MDRVEILAGYAAELDQAFAQSAAARALQVSTGSQVFWSRQAFGEDQVTYKHVASEHHCTVTLALDKLKAPPERKADPETRPVKILNTQT
jgi:hypothetical protein